MREFARKQRESLSVIPHKTNEKSFGFEVNPSALEQSFHGWRHSVSNKVPALQSPAAYGIPRLTAMDVSRVNQATIREGESHRIWPPSVIQQFNSANVITAGEVEHYVLHDANLTRVESKRRRQSNSQSAVLRMLAERD